MSEETGDARTFLERQRDAALEEQRRITSRDRYVADIVRGKSRYRTGEVPAIEDGDGETTGAFVVEVDADDLGTVWTAVNDGARLPMGWRTRATAILHLLSVRYGDGDDMGQAARYAARVLGIKDETE